MTCCLLLQAVRAITYRFIEVVAAKLDRGIGHNADAIRTVPTHEAAPAFFYPHFLECSAHGHLIFCTANTLNLEQDFEALEGRNDCAGDGSGHAATTESGDDRV